MMRQFDGYRPSLQSFGRGVMHIIIVKIDPGRPGSYEQGPLCGGAQPWIVAGDWPPTLPAAPSVLEYASDGQLSRLCKRCEERAPRARVGRS